MRSLFRGTPPEPRAVYARVLDGDSVWLAIAGARQVRLRGPDGPVLLDNDAPADRSLHAVRWRLTDLPGEDDGAYQVETADGIPVRTDPLPELKRMCTPPSRAGRWQFAVRRRPDGALEVTRTALPPHVDVLACTLDDDAVVLTLADPGGEVRLLLVDPDGVEVGAVPVVGHVARVHDVDVPAERGVHWFLAAEAAGERLPVLRTRNDNQMPGRSTLLPLLWSGDGADKHAVRFQFQFDGRVRVNRPPVGGEEP